MILPPTAQPKGLFGSGTRTRGVYGAFVRGYDSQRSGLNHSAIPLLNGQPDQLGNSKNKIKLFTQAIQTMACIPLVNCPGLGSMSASPLIWQLYFQKKTIGWAVGAKDTSRRYSGRRKLIFLESGMAEWLRPERCES